MPNNRTKVLVSNIFLAILLTGMGLAMYKMQKSGKVKAKYEAKAEAFEKKLSKSVVELNMALLFV